MKAFSSTTLLAFALSGLGANAITVKLYNNAGQSDEFAVNADGSCCEHSQLFEPIKSRF